ncbi:MAG: hypothetical protein WB697_10885 [Stellaceae bacterium]
MVNANDRETLEQAYPAEAFASDAAQNEPAAATLHRGVRIGSAPDAAGWFELEPATRHAGEPETPNFLAPAQAARHAQFLDDIVAAARRFGYRAEESPGPGDARIKGLRQ